MKILKLLMFFFRETEGFAVFGNVERSSGAVRTACDKQVDGRRGPGRPKLTWKNLK